MAYRSADRSDRWKAIAAVLLVHVVLGAVIITGLNVEIITRATERLEAFDILVPEEPPPEEPPPPPQPEPDRAPEEAGDPGKKADPTPIVAPKPPIRLPIPSPVATSRIPGTGTASTSGTGVAGTGTGAGGSGSGRGGGGTDYSKFSPAQRVSKVPNSEYRRFVATSGVRRGSVGLTVKVNTDGAPSNCRIVRSSGNSATDSLMCQLTLRYVRFRPARDAQGRPVAQDITWYPDWSPNR